MDNKEEAIALKDRAKALYISKWTMQSVGMVAWMKLVGEVVQSYGFARWSQADPDSQHKIASDLMRVAEITEAQYMRPPMLPTKKPEYRL